MSKHSEDQTAAEETTVPPDGDAVTAEGTAEASSEKVDESGADAATESADEATESADAAARSAEMPKRRIQWARVLAFGVLPAVALLLALGAGYLKYMDDSARVDDIANSKSPAHEAMQAAKDSTAVLLSYKPDTVQQQLTAARDLLTGDFRDSYTSLTNDVVIPGAKQKQISAVATVPASALVSADAHRAVVLVFVNQTVIVGQDAPTDTASSVRVTLDKIGDHWLISKFDPV
jgi:Mce-associated membrane protein